MFDVASSIATGGTVKAASTAGKAAKILGDIPDVASAAKTTRVIPAGQHPAMASSFENDFGKANQSVRPYQVGKYNELSSLPAKGDDISIHHAGQQHAMSQIVPDYNPRTAPSIALPHIEHKRIPNIRGQFTGSARHLLSRNIVNLRKYTNAPNTSL